MPQFIRILPGNDREMLINVNSITKIEVKYAEEGEKGRLYDLSPNRGLKDPSAVKSYVVHYGSESFHVLANPDSKVLKVIEGYYLGAIADEEK
jgi:hypothetical protein